MTTSRTGFMRLPERIRSVADTLRRKPMPLADIIPLLQEAADAIQSLAATEPAGACTVPPTGWTCTREPGHEGPCAALPVTQDPDNDNVCSTHPDAPHGFNRSRSISEDRYVCDCEGWEPPPQFDPRYIERINALAAAEEKRTYTEDECFVADHMMQLDFEIVHDDACVWACTLDHVLQLLRARGGAVERKKTKSNTLAHDNLRDMIGQAISDKLGEFGPEEFLGLDIFDASNIDEIADAVLKAIQVCLATPAAYRFWESKFGEFRYDDQPNPHRTCEPVFLAALKKDEEPFAWYISGPQGSHSTVYTREFIEYEVRRLATERGFEPDDYTATALYLGDKP